MEHASFMSTKLEYKCANRYDYSHKAQVIIIIKKLRTAIDILYGVLYEKGEHLGFIFSKS